MKKKYIILSSILVILILSAAIGGTMSYFTTYAHAKGGVPIHLGYRTKLNEGMFGEAKILSVENDPDSSQSIFVRAKGIAAEQYDLQYDGNNWSTDIPENWVKDEKADEYIYYLLPLAPGESMGDSSVYVEEGIPRDDDCLTVRIDFPEEPQNLDSFTVLVVYESTPAKYDEDGNPYADWTTTLEVRTSRGGN